MRAYEAAEAALEHAARARAAGRARRAGSGVSRERTCANRIAEVDNASKLIADSVGTVKTGIAQNQHELALLDEAPLNAPSSSRSSACARRRSRRWQPRAMRSKRTETQLRETEQARLATEQNLEPAARAHRGGAG